VGWLTVSSAACFSLRNRMGCRPNECSMKPFQIHAFLMYWCVSACPCDPFIALSLSSSCLSLSSSSKPVHGRGEGRRD